MSDLISRAAALDALGERPMLWVDDDNYTLGARNQYDSNRLAIETVPSVDAVPVAAYEQVRWERDIAVGQLEKLGYTLVEKVTPIVRCKDCKFSDWYTAMDGNRYCYCTVHGSSGHKGNDFCSYGEEDGDENAVDR